MGCRSKQPAPAPAPPPPLARAPSEDAEPPAAAKPVLPEVKADWCLDWKALDDANCFFVPEGANKTLLIYLAGIVPPTAKSTQKENVERVVKAAATRAKAVALLPRGRQGIGPKDAKDWWAWPTTPGDYQVHHAKLVAEWKTAQQTLEASLGPFTKVYLAGSSSGAYFISALAFSDAVDVDGYAAASGGSAWGGPGTKKRPFYVGWGAGDPTNNGPKALAAYLAAQKWPVKSAEHPFGHGAREIYLDEAFAFWTSVDHAAR